MNEWWTYELNDLILFTSHTYYRMIELYNVAVWPLQLIFILISLALPVILWKKPGWHGKALTTIVASSWIWVAGSFLWQRFENIHWIASYYALLFVIEALLLLWAGVYKNNLIINPSSKHHQWAGVTIMLFALFIQPFVTVLSGQHWKQVELFAMTPEPTTVATIGLLMLSNYRKHWWLIIIPVLWCIVSAATLWVLQSPNAFVMALTGLVAVFFIIWPGTSARQSSIRQSGTL